MNSFYTGFEKSAGFKDWMGKIKSYFTGEEKPKAKVPETFERKPVEYFRQRKGVNLDHRNLLNKTIKSNKKSATNTVTVKYKKGNGEVVTRQVTPYSAKNKNLFVGHDHHRDAVRTFRIDRIQSIK